MLWVCGGVGVYVCSGGGGDWRLCVVTEDKGKIWLCKCT